MPNLARPAALVLAAALVLTGCGAEVSARQEDGAALATATDTIR